MTKDPIVDEVRRVRDQLAAEFNYDIHAIFGSLRAAQHEYGSRLVNRPSARGEPSDAVKPHSAPLHVAD
jgi:hypothetical protein